MKTRFKKGWAKKQGSAQTASSRDTFGLKIHLKLAINFQIMWSYFGKVPRSYLKFQKTILKHVFLKSPTAPKFYQYFGTLWMTLNSKT